MFTIDHSMLLHFSEHDWSLAMLYQVQRRTKITTAAALCIYIYLFRSRVQDLNNIFVNIVAIKMSAILQCTTDMMPTHRAVHTCSVAVTKATWRYQCSTQRSILSQIFILLHWSMKGAWNVLIVICTIKRSTQLKKYQASPLCHRNFLLSSIAQNKRIMLIKHLQLCTTRLKVLAILCRTKCLIPHGLFNTFCVYYNTFWMRLWKL